MSTEPRQRIFRQVALDRLSSPEQLDSLMRVLRPASWLALGSIAVLLAVAVAWGFLGRIPIQVEGQGALLAGDGMFSVVAEGAGTIERLDVSLGDTVTAGQVIGRIAQPELERQLADARKHLEDAQTAARDDEATAAVETRLAVRALESQRAAAVGDLDARRAEVERLERQVAAHEELVRDGVVTEDVLASSRLDLRQARSRVISGEAAIENLDAELAKARDAAARGRRDRSRTVAEASQEVTRLEAQLDRVQTVVARHPGRVVEVMVGVGDAVTAGTPLVVVERHGESDGPGAGLRLIAYVSALDAYELAPGMELHAVPSVVKKEEYGSLVARVVSVGLVPATRQDMQHVLGNEPLVEELAMVGLPIEVVAELQVDPSTPSGYRWTSATGPPLTLHDGTLCSVSVVVREQAPIGLLVPGIEKALGW